MILEVLPSAMRNVLRYGVVRIAGMSLLAAGAAAFTSGAGYAASSQQNGNGEAPNVVKQVVDTARVAPLAGHVPAWATEENFSGTVPAQIPMAHMTLVLTRATEREQAFETLLGEQQNPSSPEYHHWLTAEEIGERYGLSQADIESITGWLQSQGLKVNYVAPSRVMIGFSGTAGDVARAFQTELKYYTVKGEQRIAAAYDPMIPEALTPAIKAVRGLQTNVDHPMHIARVEHRSTPEITAGSTTHYVGVADFAKIYDLPSNLNGSGVTVGIVGEARVDTADLTNFQTLMGSSFTDPTVVIPTSYGGVDPGPALTAPPTGNQSDGAQGEATLDVTRIGSVAPAATMLLVVASGASGGIDPAAEYLVDTTPVPAKVMSVSWGACETQNGSSGVTYWDTLFKQAAGEGISVFVSSGDSGASGCDTHNAAPPASPEPNSPNYICSSSYATCVGGTEFNDASDYSKYWSGGNGSGYESVLSYIPEGAWNEPLNSNSQTQVAASGGGVSVYIKTPSWQTGTGVPSARTGRYTPDVSFTASGHDGYFACFAAGGGSCVSQGGGGFYFDIFSGTSASAPDMAGVAALLDQKKGSAQGNLNPGIYSLAASMPSAFHDVTVSTSGVGSCSLSTPSMCNNSAPGPSGLTGGQAGYMVGTGYDEVTGWGSLDVSVFLNNYSAGTTVTVPATPTLSSPANGTSLAAGTTSETLSWGAVTGATAYNVQVYTASCGGTLFKQVTGATTTSTSLTGLTNGTTYYWRAQAGNTAGNSSYSSCFNFNVKTAAAPAVPTLTSPSNGSTVTTSSTTLKWNAVSGATSYGVLAYTGSCGGTTVSVASPGANTSVALTGLTTGKTYYWKVDATGSGGTSAYSSCFNFTTKIPPATPTLTTPANGATVTSSSTTLKWNAVSGATGYAVQMYTGSCGGTAVTVGSPGANASLALTGLIPGNTYYWRVDATGSGGTSAYSGCFDFMSRFAPAVPTLTTPANGATVTTASTTLKWNAVGGATSYGVLAYTGSCGGTAVTVSAPGANTSVALTGLTTGKTYYWQVKSQDNSGSSAYSSCFSFTTKIPPATPTLTTPANTASLTAGTTSTSLKWSAVSGATSYSVQAYTGSCGGTAMSVSSPGAATSVTLSGLSNGKTYYWRVNATGSGGSSAYSSCFSFSVL